MTDSKITIVTKTVYTGADDRQFNTHAEAERSVIAAKMKAFMDADRGRYPVDGYSAYSAKQVARAMQYNRDEVIRLLGGRTMPPVDQLAQIIRMVDGENALGAGALAEAIIEAVGRLRG